MALAPAAAADERQDQLTGGRAGAGAGAESIRPSRVRLGPGRSIALASFLRAAGGELGASRLNLNLFVCFLVCLFTHSPNSWRLSDMASQPAGRPPDRRNGRQTSPPAPNPSPGPTEASSGSSSRTAGRPTAFNHRRQEQNCASLSTCRRVRISKRPLAPLAAAHPAGEHGALAATQIISTGSGNKPQRAMSILRTIVSFGPLPLAPAAAAAQPPSRQRRRPLGRWPISATATTVADHSSRRQLKSPPEPPPPYRSQSAIKGPSTTTTTRRQPQPHQRPALCEQPVCEQLPAPPQPAHRCEKSIKGAFNYVSQSLEQT